MLQFGLGIVRAKKETKAKEVKVREVVELNPILTATSVAGRFEITSKAIALLGMEIDDNVMFVSNYEELLAAIENGMEALVEDCISQGLDIKSTEGRRYLVDKYGELFIAKGIEKFKSDGEVMLAKPKKSKAELEELLATQRMDLIVSKRTEIESRLVEAGVITHVGEATDEQLLAEVNIKDVEVPFEAAKFGSKMSAISTSVQGTRTFTDSTLYKQLLVPEGSKIIFNVTAESSEYPINDGCKEVTIPIYKLVFDKVMEAQKRTRKSKEAEETTEQVVTEQAPEEHGLFDQDMSTDVDMQSNEGFGEGADFESFN